MSVASRTLVASIALAGCGDGVGLEPGAFWPGAAAPEGSNHGVVQLELRRGIGVTETPFADTAVIVAKLDYEPCLADFYAREPAWTLEGEQGAPLFESGRGVEAGLCSLSEIDCRVHEFTQSLSAMEGGWLQVVYEVEGIVEGRRLPFGPIPLPELADCDPPESPSVRIATKAAVRGYDGIPIDGSPLWILQSFDPASAAPGEDNMIALDVVPAR